MNTIRSVLAFLACSAAAASAGAAGAGLLASTDSAGGAFAPGQRATVRVLNPGAETLSGVAATVTPNSGFKIVGNTCAKALAPRGRCELVLAWEPVASRDASATLALRSGSPALETTVALRGVAAASR